MLEHSFQEVVRQWKRMCETQFECDRCPVDGIGCCGNVSALTQPEQTEKAIRSWAAEHPEPVYPTWGEFFVSRSMLPEKWDDLTSAYMNVGCVPNLIHSPIPADIAQKLGIEPKEGT